MTKESHGDVSSGLERPLAAEVDIAPLSTIEKALTTSLDKKCMLSTNKKPWSRNKTVTLLPVEYASQRPGSVIRHY